MPGLAEENEMVPRSELKDDTEPLPGSSIAIRESWAPDGEMSLSRGLTTTVSPVKALAKSGVPTGLRLPG